MLAELIFKSSSDTIFTILYNMIQGVVPKSCKLLVYSLKIKGVGWEKEICNSTTFKKDDVKSLSPWFRLLLWAKSQLIGDLNRTLKFLISEITRVEHKDLTISFDKECLLELNGLTNIDNLCNYLKEQEIIYEAMERRITFTGDITQKDIKEKISSALFDFRINFIKENIEPILKKIFFALSKDYPESLCCYLVKFYDKESDLEEILMTFTGHTAAKNVSLEQLLSIHDLKEQVEYIHRKVQSWKETCGKWEIKYDTGCYFNLTSNQVLDSKLLKFVAANNGLEQSLVKDDQGNGNIIGMKFPMTESLDILSISNSLINEYDEITQAQENIQATLSVICGNTYIESYSPLQAKLFQ